MVLSVRNKIWLGTIFLFLLLMFTGGAGIYYIAIMKGEAKAVLKDNYETLAWCHDMQQQLDSIDLDYNKSVPLFEIALKKQEHNITEQGEGNYTGKLRTEFEQLKAGDTTIANFRLMHNTIQHILNLNMEAIHRKTVIAETTSEKRLTLIIAIAAIIFMISFTFSVNFPSIVTNPIIQLTEAIKEITNKNYRHRIFIENKDEFGELADAFNNMAQRLEYFESSNLNKLMFEKSRAEAVINSLKDASIGIDKNNIILFANFQALQLLGLKANEIVGKKVEELASSNDLFAFLVNNESTTPFKIVVENRENYFVREVVEVAQGEGNSKVIVLRNITSFKELDVAKTNFIATISHELKTPLAASDFSLKLLSDERIGTLSDEQKELIENLKQDNQRVLKILSELLNMSQVESGRIKINVNEVSPYQIVQNAMETVSSGAKEKNIEIIKDLAEGLPSIMADTEKSTWVLNNLLTNALKFTTSGSSIRLTVKQNDKLVVFSVTDTGPGIAPEYQTKLFDRYFQVPGVNIKGTGLGLSISKEFIDAQKGRIWVESKPGTGSVFSFSLPMYS